MQPEDDLTPVPDGVEPAEAEALILNGLTAWRMLNRVAQVQPGQTVMVLGANGGVGSLLVQLARLASVRVIGTASARNLEAVRELGAIPIDRHEDVLNRALEIAPGRECRRF